MPENEIKSATDAAKKAQAETIAAAAAEKKAPAAAAVETAQPGSLADGREFIADIVKEPPAPVPGLAEKLQAGSRAADSTPPKPGKAPAESGCPDGIRVNPEDWKHLKDWKKRSFDPNLHKVNLDGTPAIGTKNRLQCLASGEKNPVKVFLSRLSGNEFDSVEIESQDEAHAQAQAVVDHGRIARKARRVVQGYFTGGAICWGLRFMKGRAERAKELEETMVDLMVETGKEIDIDPRLTAIGAYVADFEKMLYLNFGENPEEGAVKKFLLRRLPFIRWFIRKPRKAQKKEEAVNLEVEPDGAA